MAKFFDSPYLSASILTPISRTAKPSSEFYSVFSKEEVLSIIHALEFEREIPLKYSYKGRGAKIWDDFYLKYTVPKWYRTSSIEIDLLRENFEYVNGNLNHKRINVVDVGAGNSYPTKEFVHRLNNLNRIDKYVALDISQELLDLSKRNFEKWFPLIQFAAHTVDVENDCLSEILLKDQAGIETATPKVILHLGVTIGNHRYRNRVLKNFRDSMRKGDLLVFTNEIGSNSKWDGRVRGGCKYHAKQVYEWIKNKIGIREGCELVRKYDLKTDSVVANMKFLCNYTINFSSVDKSIEIFEGEEITIWRHHKYEMPELLQELERAGLQLVHYTTNKYSSHIMAICEVATSQSSIDPDALQVTSTVDTSRHNQRS